MTRTAVALACLLACSSTSAPPEEHPRVRVDLVDGSRIVGTLQQSSIAGRTSYGKLDIPLESVHQFTRLDDGRIRLNFANGDELTAQPAFDQLKCTTLFGGATLKMEHIRRLHVQSNVLQSLPARNHVVLYYGFDSAEEKKIPNQARDGMDANNIGAKWTQHGANGGAIEFDGSSRIEVPHDNRLCPRTFTFAAWVYPTAESSNYEMLIAKTNPSSWSGGYGICRISGDKKNIRFFINSYTSTHKTRPLPIRKWTHIACVAHGEGIQFYMNGQPMPAEVKTSRRPPNLLTARVQHTTTPMTLGGDPSHYGWKGRMDEFLLFDRALSGKQIRQLYTMFAPAEVSSDAEIAVPATQQKTGAAPDGNPFGAKDSVGPASEGANDVEGEIE